MAPIILMGAVEVARIPVLECGDPLVDLRESSLLEVDPRQADPDGAYAMVREGVAVRLERAARLLPDGLRLLVTEGYRPLALQTRYFDEYRAELRRTHPDWPDGHLRSQTSRSVAPPETAPHVAGAAVDLTLCTTGGDELDLGTPVDASPEASGGACYTDAPDISDQARHNRRALCAALTTAGLINYPTEWWHWSYGDRYWALLTGAPAARYGPM
ncbi:M15 family metallopeptidase [Streptomyces coerulescens]|uniref:D-alanyl-D-alanine dipeptidase n=1 Tax=Streptomyces coerulescens TaxID=29304 RepID=A0ABW0CTK6_STRCD